MKRLFYYFAAIVAGAMLALACEPEAQPETPGNEDNGGNQNTTVEVTSVTLNEETVALEVEDVFTIEATVLPENATNKAVTYESKNPAVATVDSFGLVTAVAEGTAVIEVTAGGKTAQLTVTVTVPEVAETSFSDLAENCEEISEGVYAIELPLGEGYSFAGSFDFKDFFVNLPADATFALAPVEDQNEEVAGYYEALTESLAADGVWTRNERFTCDLNVGEDNSDNGVRVVVVSANNETLYTINFYIVDPIINLETVDQNGHVYLKDTFCSELASHYDPFSAVQIELGGDTTYEMFALRHGDDNDFNLVELLNDISNFQSVNMNTGPYFSGNDAEHVLFKEWPKFSLSGTNGEEIFYNDVSKCEIAYSEYGQNLVSQSKGLYWQQTWSVAWTNCSWQLPEADRPALPIDTAIEFNGVTDYVDPEPVKAFVEAVGIYLTEDGHIKTTADYKGTAARIAPRLHFEYDYGYVCVSQRYMFFLYLNRRWAAPGEVSDSVYPFNDGLNE